MRELNAAWAVLRNPAARARYDAELQDLVQPSLGGPVGTSEAARRFRGEQVRREWVSPPVGDLEREQEAAAPKRRGRLGPFGPVVVLGVVVLLVLVVTAYAGGGGRSTSGPQVETGGQFPVGACVVRAFGPQTATPEPEAQARPVIVEVPCGTEGAATVVGRAPLPQPCPAGTRAWILPDSRDSLCVRVAG